LAQHDFVASSAVKLNVFEIGWALDRLLFLGNLSSESVEERVEQVWPGYRNSLYVYLFTLKDFFVLG